MKHPIKSAADEFIVRDWPLIRFVARAAFWFVVAVVGTVIYG